MRGWPGRRRLIAWWRNSKVRGSRGRVGERDSARAARRLWAGLARRTLSRRLNRLDALETPQRSDQLFELEYLGAQDLKGIAGPVRVWAALRPASVESRFEAFH